MKILIIGGAGFIGSHLSDKLISLNHDVYILDNLSSGSIFNLQSKCRDTKHFYTMDIYNKIDVDDAFVQIKPDVVYHLAAQINVRHSIKDPSFDADINIIGLLNVLEKCKKYKVKKIIFSSSGGAIYQDNNELIKNESSIIQPMSPYGISKFTGEQYINFYKNIYELDSAILRFSNVYGPRQGGGESGVLSIFISNLLSNKPLTIFGDGEQTRDYVYVSDVVDALVACISISGTYNVSTGVATSLNDVVKIINNIMLCTNVIYSDAVAGELRHNCLSSSNLQTLGWKPSYKLSDGIRETIEWFKSQR